MKWLSSFGSNSTLESITIQTSGQGVYYIYGFSGCSNLKRATIGGNARINAGAFSGCASLTSVSLGANCEVGEAAFQNTTALSSVTVGEGCTIGEDAFAGCTSLTSITLPASCVYDWEAFPDGLHRHRRDPGGAVIRRTGQNEEEIWPDRGPSLCSIRKACRSDPQTTGSAPAAIPLGTREQASSPTGRSRSWHSDR